jgi:hypothetical protein
MHARIGQEPKKRHAVVDSVHGKRSTEPSVGKHHAMLSQRERPASSDGLHIFPDGVLTAED